MLIELKNAKCIDGVNATSVRNLYMENGVLLGVSSNRRVDHSYDLKGAIVMPCGIDMHTHIGGGKVNLARLLLPEIAINHAERSALRHQEKLLYGSKPLSSPVPAADETGLRYLEMGYTTCLEPAVLPANARAAHYEMADIPWLDTGGYLVLGNERMLLEMISSGASQATINAYVGAMITIHKCCGIKVVNAGGIDAFKFNQRALDVDTLHSHYQISPRVILKTLARAVDELRLPHPLHVHCSNLGVAGNIASTMATLQAVEGQRVHLTHAQYHCYGAEGQHMYSSESRQLSDYVNEHPNVTIDVGQVLFGQTVTISGDTMHQFTNRSFAEPRKTIFQDTECQAGCGVVPFHYRESDFVNGLQWTIGLELCLNIENPRQVFLTTDHPNGGPFTAYPHLIRLLTSYDYRMEAFERLHSDLKQVSSFPSIKREYTIEEIALMTRQGPADILGLQDRGSLSSGQLADIVVYDPSENLETMFANPTMVFKRGELVKRGDLLTGASKKSTITASPQFDPSHANPIIKQWRDCYGYSVDMVKIHDEELLSDSRSIVEVMHPSI